ncbi:chaperonin 10-like protein [Sphaerosporella brunnea]|uniref:D-xylulose reductase n=1 Tax=Sphaerosporella brunnea TaxID=1250544 RepID=A0A5J5F5N8_9PEZI|nr:chaperonin 10-like protein [Sphaerosporella brunnea]
MATGANPSFVLRAVKDVAFEDRPIPTLKNDTDVLIKIEVTGICGSDVHYWQHGGIGPFILKAPMVLGHESAGTVVSVGSRVTSLAPGDRVALEPGIPCRMCDFCKGGKYNLCAEMRFAATPPYDGSLAKYYVLPADFCVKLPEHVSLEEGALVEPLSVGVHVAKLADVRPGESVVIFGAGPVGLLCAAVARAYGAMKIVVVDISQPRLDFAAKYAATHVFNGTHSRDPKVNAQAIKEQFGLGGGADKAIDASGAPPCIQAGIYVLKQGGTFVQVGMGPADIQFPIVEMAAKELVVKGSFRYAAGDYKLAVELIAAGKVEVKSLITGRWKFEDAEKAFQETLEGKGIKVLIKGPE